MPGRPVLLWATVAAGLLAAAAAWAGRPLAAVLLLVPAAVLWSVALRPAAVPEDDDVDEVSGVVGGRTFLADAQRMMDGEEGHPAVLVVDIDRFRDVETVLGDDRAATVLREVATRIRTVAGELPVGALGVERFAIGMMARPFLPAHHLGRSLREAISQPLTVDGVELRLTSSVGMAMGEGGAVGLVRRASIAAVAAAADQDGLEVHRPEEAAAVRRRLAVASALTDALEQPERHDFRPEFQPIVDPTGAFVGAEALARWDDPQLGRVSPEEFIALAEQTGLVGPLLSVMLGRALAGCARWREAGLTATVSVNLSALNLRQPLLLSELTAALDAAGLAPEDVTLEVTETAVIADAQSALRTLTELRTVGFKVALDDFGVGQSSLARLRELPVTSVKLDKTFIDPLLEDPRSLAVVQATVHVCGALGLDVVAEGVERLDQVDVLRAIGVRRLQGWFYSRAIPVEQVILTQRNPSPVGSGGPGGVE